MCIRKIRTRQIPLPVWTSKHHSRINFTQVIWHWPGMLIFSIRKISCGWANNIDYSNTNTSVKKEKKYICVGEHLQNFCIITDSTCYMVPAYGGKYPSKIFLQRWSLVICQCLPRLPGDFTLRIRYNWCSVLSFGLLIITTACVI